MTLSQLPPLDDELQFSYLNLIGELEEEMKNLIDTHFRDTLKCRPGCSDCCIEFSVFPLEAAVIQEELYQKKYQDKSPGTAKTSGSCCFLENGLCRVYNRRPIICRTQGLPVAYIDEDIGAIQVSACRLNFDDEYNFTQDELLFLDRFNDELARLNSLYCAAAGIDPMQRIAISDIINQSDFQ